MPPDNEGQEPQVQVFRATRDIQLSPLIALKKGELISWNGTSLTFANTEVEYTAAFEYGRRRGWLVPAQGLLAKIASFFGKAKSPNI